MKQHGTSPIVLQEEKEGGYSVTNLSLEGCYSQGETVEEALINLINRSTKAVNSPGAGNGLYVSSRMIRYGKCPKSGLIIYSGNRYLDIGDNKMFLRNSHLGWQGTVVVLRVGYGISGDFKESMGYEPEFIISYD